MIPSNAAMLKDWLRAARAAAARSIAAAIHAFPSLEPGFIVTGRWCARRLPLVGTLYWFAQDELIRSMRRSRRRFRVHEVAGIDLAVDVTDGSARLLHFYGKPYEPGLAQAIRERLGPGDVFLDIGANIGYFSVLAGATVAPTGRVIAFEPHPAAREILQQAVTVNALGDVIEIVPAAVADRDGVAALFLTADTVLSTTDPSRSPMRSAYTFPDSIDVPQVTLDAWLGARTNLVPRVRAIKIDVEGTEADVLRGMAETLRACPGATIFCETIEGSDADRFLRGLGYEAAAIDSYGGGFGNYRYQRRVTDPATASGR
jgi:FkbM family methyltransferase